MQRRTLLLAAPAALAAATLPAMATTHPRPTTAAELLAWCQHSYRCAYGPESLTYTTYASIGDAAPDAERRLVQLMQSTIEEIMSREPGATLLWRQVPQDRVGTNIHGKPYRTLAVRFTVEPRT